ncbi:MAG: MFS transporter, partial [Chloroflexota bacterium]
MPDSSQPPEVQNPERHRQASLGGMPGYLASIGSFERNVKLFLTVTALRGMLIASLQTVVNLYLYSLGYDARFIGIINGSNAVAVLVVSVPLGYVADRVGRRPVLLVGGAGYPLAILFLSLSHGTALIMVFNFLFGAFSSAYWVAGVPLLFASTKPHERVQAFSINSFLLWGLGPLGALISGQVVEAAARIGGTPASSSSALRIGLFFIVLLGAVGFFPLLFLRERRAAVPHAKQPAPSS